MIQSGFWRDIEIAYNQVALNHERVIEVSSIAEGLYARVHHLVDGDAVVIEIGALVSKKSDVKLLTYGEVNA